MAAYREIFWTPRHLIETWTPKRARRAARRRPEANPGALRGAKNVARRRKSRHSDTTNQEMAQACRTPAGNASFSRG